MTISEKWNKQNPSTRRTQEGASWSPAFCVSSWTNASGILFSFTSSLHSHTRRHFRQSEWRTPSNKNPYSIRVDTRQFFTLSCDVLVKFHLKCEKQSLESLKVIHFWLVPMCHKIFRFFFFNFTINKKKIMTAFYCFYSFDILLVYVNKLHMYMCWK